MARRDRYAKIDVIFPMVWWDNEDGDGRKVGLSTGFNVKTLRDVVVVEVLPLERLAPFEAGLR